MSAAASRARSRDALGGAVGLRGERGFEGADAARQGLADAVAVRADRRNGVGGGGGEPLVDVARLRREAGDDLLSARVEEFGRGLRACGERLVDAFVGCAEGGLERAAALRHGFRQLVGGRVQAARKIVAAVEDRLADARARFVDARGRFGAAAADFRRQRFARAAQALFGLAQRRGDALRGVVEALREIAGEETDVLGDVLSFRAQARDDELAEGGERHGDADRSFVEIARDAFPGLAEVVHDPRALVADALGHDVARLGDPGGDGLCLRLDARQHVLADRGDAFAHALGDVGEARGHRIAGMVETVDDRTALRLDALEHVLAERGEAFAHALGDVGEARRDVVAGAAEALDDRTALRIDALDDEVAAAREHEVDLLGLGAEGGGDARARVADAFGHARAGEIELVREFFLRAGDRLAQAFGVADDGLALGGEFVDQRADAALVVGVGALEVGHLRAQHGFEFAGAGERALDAVAHGGDFAADRLRERHHLFGGDSLGLCETDGDLLHRAGGQAHFLRAAGEAGGGEEEGERAEHAQSKQGGVVDRQRPLAGRVEAVDVERGEPEPDEAGERGEDEGRAARARLERLENLADGRTIVVGGGAHAGGLCGLGVLAVFLAGVFSAFFLAKACGVCGWRLHGHGRGGEFVRQDGGQARLVGVDGRLVGGLFRSGFVGRGPGGVLVGLGPEIDEVQRLLDRGHGRSRWILSLGRIGHLFRLTLTLNRRSPKNRARPRMGLKTRAALVNHSSIYSDATTKETGGRSHSQTSLTARPPISHSLET